MQNDEKKFKAKLERRICSSVVKLNKFLDSLSKDTVSRRFVNQLSRGGSSIEADYIGARASSFRIKLSNIFDSSILTLKGRKRFFIFTF